MTTERDADDGPDLLARIDRGDRLWLRSPLGDARTVDVLAVEERAIEVRDKTTDPITGRVSEHRNRYTLRELRDAHAVGDLRLDVQRPASGDAIHTNRGP